MFIRKKNRLPNKTLYESDHRYFITLCTHNRKCILTVAPKTVGHHNTPIWHNNEYVTPDTVGHHNTPIWHNNKYVAPDTVGHHNTPIWHDNEYVTPDTVGHNDDTVGHNNDTHTLPLTEIGKIIETIRYQLPNMFWNIILDAFIIMPNHIHGIIWFNGTPYSLFTEKSTNLWNIIKRFKLETGNQSKKHAHLLWSLPLRQKSFHDHIIRNEEELQRIQQYIINNPLQRTNDSLYTNTSH